MDLNDEAILGRFPVGYYSFHPNVSLNFQMNRFWNWVGDKQMLEELKAVGTRISNYDDCFLIPPMRGSSPPSKDSWTSFWRITASRRKTIT